VLAEYNIKHFIICLDYEISLLNKKKKRDDKSFEAGEIAEVNIFS
jgi:hypothetical protein